jgi:hypothetical protein
MHHLNVSIKKSIEQLMQAEEHFLFEKLFEQV